LIGDDTDGDRLHECCAAAGIEARLQRAAERTTVKLRVLAQHHQLLRLDFETIPVTERLAITPDVASLVPQMGAVVLSDYAKGALLNPASWIELARRHGKPVVVDPKSRDFGRYAGADLITPNSAEFEAVVGHCDSDAELAARGRELCRTHGLGAVLVTRGERGMSLVRADGESLHLSAQARDVFDVTGAGDTVCAIVASALAAGSDLATATMLANAAAGLVVGKLGTAVVSNAELKAAVSPEHHPVPAIQDERQLLEEVAAARARGERIVMTNGCFDILHRGHVTYLAQARALGASLIVAVNTDASVKRLGKGSGTGSSNERPINPLADRMALLAALESVSRVTWFDEDTPLARILDCHPDVLVKGGDWPVEKIVGYREVTGWGGSVHAIPFIHQKSTTALLEKIRQL
jgi:D-beta-D-heptose 7-phosphate kinase/D-beta-D-heptose 1-phosphate adenosyltransferase